VRKKRNQKHDCRTYITCGESKISRSSCSISCFSQKRLNANMLSVPQIWKMMVGKKEKKNANPVKSCEWYMKKVRNIQCLLIRQKSRIFHLFLVKCEMSKFRRKLLFCCQKTKANRKKSIWDQLACWNEFFKLFLFKEPISQLKATISRKVQVLFSVIRNKVWNKR